MCRTLGTNYTPVHDKCLCLSYVFGSVLDCMCKVCSRVSEALLLALRTLSLTNNSSSDSRAFLRFIAFSGSPTAVYRPLHARALWHYTVGIPFWTARKRVTNVLSSTEKPHTACSSHLITHYHCVHVTGRYTEHCTWRKWLTCSLVAVSL